MDDQLKAVVAFHGHLCPGLLIGYRAALVALNTLGGQRAEDEELVAIVENDSCSVDAIQFLTGCTFGKGNFIFRDWGKQVFTLAWRPEGRAVRVSYQRDRVTARMPEGRTDREAKIQVLLTAPGEVLFDLRHIKVDLPGLARIFPTIPCDECGEGVMEPRLFQFSGRKICLECLLKQDLSVTLTQTADFLFEMGMLKKTPRTGYQFLGNGHENVATHSFRTAIIGYLLARMTNGADAHRTLHMCLFHDLAEARTGDQNYVNKQYVVADEARAVRDCVAQVPCGREIEGYLHEFNAGLTVEAQLAADADQLDLIVELKEKKDLGNRYAEAWLFYARKRLKTKIGQDLHDAIMKTDWTHWWFDKKDHLWVRES